jgi:hypothetical protein
MMTVRSAKLIPVATFDNIERRGNKAQEHRRVEPELAHAPQQIVISGEPGEHGEQPCAGRGPPDRQPAARNRAHTGGRAAEAEHCPEPGSRERDVGDSQAMLDEVEGHTQHEHPRREVESATRPPERAHGHAEQHAEATRTGPGLGLSKSALDRPAAQPIDDSRLAHGLGWA